LQAQGYEGVNSFEKTGFEKNTPGNPAHTESPKEVFSQVLGTLRATAALVQGGWDTA
jgi:hypothetical protein